MKVGKGICPWCGEVMDGRFDVDNDTYVWLCASCKFDTVVFRKDFKKYDILKEIKNLRYQAQNNRRTHFDELAEYQEQIADWLQELVDIRKIQQDDIEYIDKTDRKHRLRKDGING